MLIFPHSTAAVVFLMLGLTLAAVPAAAAEPTATLHQASGGLKGYISMNVARTPLEYRSGVSFYASIWPLLEKPLAGFQIGLPGTWIMPDNTDFKDCLCPPGTVAGDNWPERGPTYRDVFQTIEGGLGFWVSTQFPSATPKYRMNGTPNCYTHEISSPGWGFGRPQALDSDNMGLAQLSNRLLVPPDGFTFPAGGSGELLGNAWMSLPLMEPPRPAANPVSPTGDQSWTLFLNAANFKGPVAFWIPETWSKLSQTHPALAGRGLDTRPAIMQGGAMEVNTVPYFEAEDAHGIKYSRVPRLQFPVDKQGKTVLMQDVTMYSTRALYDGMKSWFSGAGVASGKFDRGASWTPRCSSNPITFKQGPHDIPLTGIEKTVQTAVSGGPGAAIFGLQWTGSTGEGIFPEYYRQEGDRMVAVAAAEVPAETQLTAQVFAPAAIGQPYTSPARDADQATNCWNHPGPVRGPFHVKLTDGSTVTYLWYRFVDQPAVQHLGLSTEEKARLQSLVERIHARWPITGDYLPPPSSGTLAALDPALLVVPPRGLKVGYVPIVTGQE